ncbi:NADH-quinone oxidoreductase subunit NuoK [Phycicoccus sonneratiae]|uniref:NADH-quinone oxidoreductase subunit K n=1 Tax=Phycicoccus sonneratiae TaxID=2807628 RepID=A0ABS2CIZ7_9MICO|nr:NADH-quinone oxidoreductase subunit NuoK [Phycicoccus sonneraticus]MBM6399857.1 NADH-quinone oxidoreductase subunit NuoK [Phycicoccus sonneraticus]
MIHLVGPYLLAAALVGLGVAGIAVRRNAVLLLVGVELVLSGGLVLLLTTQATGADRWAAGSVLPLFVITIAAAEVVVALAVVLAVFRLRGSIDLDAASDATDREEAP